MTYTSNKKLIMNKLMGLSLIVLSLGLFMLFTNPHEVVLPLIILPFIFIGLITYKLVILIILLRGRSLVYKDRMFPLSIAFMVTCLMLLQSLHQLTWKDSLLVFVFSGLLWLYISKADFLEKRR